MSAEENKAIVRRFFELMNEGGFAGVGEVWTEDLTWHGSFGEIRGLEAFIQMGAAFFAAFPGLHISIEDVIAQGDKVAVRITWQGTHQGEFMGIPPTGKPVTVTGINLYRVANGKIVEEWWQEDILGLMQQLGVLPPPPAQGG
jgi:steroid delta-isomerase-like uncharacterized protein